MSEWQPPNGVTGAISALVISTGKIGDSPFMCPMKVAVNARRGLEASRQPSRRGEKLEQFTLDPIMAELDRLEGVGHTTSWTKPVHPGLAQWAVYAVGNYQREFASTPEDLPVLKPVAGRSWTWKWRPAEPSSPVPGRELSVWGRSYAASDGSVCELRMIMFRRNEDTAETRRARAAIAAHIIAKQRPGVRRIRVVDFACLEGVSEVRFDGSPEEAHDRFVQLGAPAVAALLQGDTYRPGSSCADCTLITTCPALTQVRGLLELNGRNRPRRSWSPSAGRAYDVCAARYFLRYRLHLPVDNTLERNPTAERGRAIHRLIALAHDRSPVRPCSPGDVIAWPPAGLPPEETELGHRLIAEHSQVCPLLHLDPGAELRTEPQLAFWDPDANVVVSAAPDLLYRDEDSWVWREIKTSRSSRPWHGDPLQRFPQLSLAVLLLRHGALGSGTRRRVELEILRPGNPDAIPIDPFDGATYESARQTIRRMVAPWHADDLFLARPGECADCVVSRWCPSATKSGDAG